MDVSTSKIISGISDTSEKHSEQALNESRFPIREIVPTHARLDLFHLSSFTNFAISITDLEATVHITLVIMTHVSSDIYRDP